MLGYVKVFSPAKINLSLKVLPKRSDGYHDIESIFQLIPFGDELEVFTTNNENTCIVNCKQMELPKQNTLTKTYSEFVKMTGINCGIRVELTKRIPQGAGLGGGSSNAASLLRALNTMFDVPLDEQKCHQIAQKIGSDVPFFLSGGNVVNPYNDNLACVVYGRGEKYHLLSEFRKFFYVLICPEVHSSTVEAYKLVDENQDLINDGSCPVLNKLEEMYKMSVSEWQFYNSFTDVLCQQYPVIRQALDDLKAFGSVYYQMSGSGSSVYGIFNSLEEAKIAHKELAKKWKRCFILPSS